jgi:hypothetical protein
LSEEGIEIKDGYLIIKVKADADPRLSGSGKSRVLFSTRGNIKMPDGSSVGLNWYRPA